MKKFLLSLLAFMLFAPALMALDRRFTAVPSTKPSLEPIMPQSKYDEWTGYKNQTLRLSPVFNFDSEWEDNLEYLQESLQEADGIFIQLKDSESRIIADKGLATRLSSQLSALEAVMKSYEDKLRNLGDDAQLQNIDLQDALQKQQQLIQLLSNVSKMIHDTQAAIIRKLG